MPSIAAFGGNGRRAFRPEIYSGLKALLPVEVGIDDLITRKKVIS